MSEEPFLEVHRVGRISHENLRGSARSAAGRVGRDYRIFSAIRYKRGKRICRRGGILDRFAILIPLPGDPRRPQSRCSQNHGVFLVAFKIKRLDREFGRHFETRQADQVDQLNLFDAQRAVENDRLVDIALEAVRRSGRRPTAYQFRLAAT